MGAPKGNKNGLATQFKALVADEPTMMVGARLPISEVEKLNQIIAKSGKSKADWIREAIAEKVKQELA